ncbi:hypothetical protein MG5_04130, partial [Candida albicans P57072]
LLMWETRLINWLKSIELILSTCS